MIQNGLVIVYYHINTKLFFSKIYYFVDLAKNEKLEYYIDYLKQHRNAESRIEHALKLCNQSKSVNRSFFFILTKLRINKKKESFS